MPRIVGPRSSGLLNLHAASGCFQQRHIRLVSAPPWLPSLLRIDPLVPTDYVVDVSLLFISNVAIRNRAAQSPVSLVIDVRALEAASVAVRAVSANTAEFPIQVRAVFILPVLSRVVAENLKDLFCQKGRPRLRLRQEMSKEVPHALWKTSVCCTIAESLKPELRKYY